MRFSIIGKPSDNLGQLPRRGMQVTLKCPFTGQYYSRTLLGVGVAAWPGADLGEPGLVMPRQPGVDDGGGSQPQSRWLIHTET
jgi:hypothetical protein